MKHITLFVALVLAAGLLVGAGGCSHAKVWDKATLEAAVKDGSNKDFAKRGIKGRITEVHLVKKSDYEFIGFETASDGSQRNLTVNVDPSTGDYVTNLSQSP